MAVRYEIDLPRAHLAGTVTGKGYTGPGRGVLVSGQTFTVATHPGGAGYSGTQRRYVNDVLNSTTPFTIAAGGEQAFGHLSAPAGRSRSATRAPRRSKSIPRTARRDRPGALGVV